MASVFLDPGVYIKERDESLVVSIVSQVVGAMVAPFKKGDDSEPFYVTSPADFINKCGIPDPAWSKAYYAALKFLKYANKLFIYRIVDGAKYACGLVDEDAGSAPSIVSGGLENPQNYSFDDTENPISDEVIGTGNGTEAHYTGTLANVEKGIKPISINITTIDIADNPMTVTDDGAGHLIGDVDAGGVNTINYTTGEYDVTFNANVKDVTNIECDYIYYTENYDMIVVYASSKGSWINNKYAFEILDGGDETLADEFYFVEYLKNEDNTYAELSRWIVSMNNKQNLSGENIFIENVVNNKSTIFKIITNSDYVDNDSIPVYSPAELDMSDGSNGNIPSNSDIANAWAIFKNKDKYDIKVLIEGGFVDTTIQAKMIEVAEERKDCIAILDGKNDTVANAIDYVKIDLNVDTSYTAMYYPWVKIKDTYNDLDVVIPPSGLGAMCIAQSANVNPYKPPAGLNRAKVFEGILQQIPTVSERQDLTDAKINLIRNFPGIGKAVFNELTMQKRPSATSFLSTRLLLIAIRKALAAALLFVNFEWIGEETYLSMYSMVTKFMDEFLGNGVSRYEFKCDEDIQTEQSKAKKELNANLVFIPMSSANAIKLNIIYTQDSARFNELAGKIYS